MNSFARSQLEKHGWVEGKGLGKSENGITAAIKPSMKFNSYGIGYNVVEQEGFEWWHHVFNKTVNNIEVTNSEDGVRVESRNDLPAVISARKLKNVSGRKKSSYGNFLKTGTLENGNIVDSPDCIEASVRHSLRVNDETIFGKCHGRTAHKAARHGMRMNGKLKRVQEQDDEIMSSTWRKQFVEETGAETVQKHRKRKLCS